MYVAFTDTSGGIWQPVSTVWTSYDDIGDDEPWHGTLLFPELTFTGAGVDCLDEGFTASFELSWAFADDPVWVHHASGGMF